MFVRFQTTIEKPQKCFAKFPCFDFHEHQVRASLPSTRVQTDGWTETFDRALCSRANVKVKSTLVQALRLCTGPTAHRGSGGIALLFLDHGTRRGWGVSFKPRPLFTPGEDPVPIVQEGGWAPGPVWTGAENLAPPGFDPRTVQPVASPHTDWTIPTHTANVPGTTNKTPH